MLVQLLQVHAENAVNGKLGQCLDSLIVYGEAMVWGGTTHSGTATTGAAGSMIGVASALAGIFCIILAARIAFKSMAEGERIDVLALLKPIILSLVLANWYGLSAGLYHIFKPIENRFKAVYEWNNDRVDSLRLRRDTLTFVMRGEIEQARAELIISEIRQRRGVKEEEEKPQDGDLVLHGNEVSINEVEFGDVLNSDIYPTVNDEGEEEVKPDIKELMENARKFGWLENVVKWVGEVLWSVSLYIIFLAKYLFLYVLVMFGPIYMVCSILPSWKNAWSQWVEKYVIVGMYGTAAYLCLIFGLMIIENTVRADITSFELAMLDDDRFYSYIQMASRFSGLSSIGMYFIALLVTGVALAMSFELAGFVFPGDVGKSAGQFFGGMQSYIEKKVEQAQQAVRDAALTALTAGTATAAIKTAEQLEKEMDEQMNSDSAETTNPSEVLTENEATSSSSQKPDDKTAETTAEDSDEWIVKADAAEEEKRAQQELEEAMGGKDSDTVKLYYMTDDAHKWADRQTFITMMGPAYRLTGEDLAADIRDSAKLKEANDKGIGSLYDSCRKARLRENMFLLQVVRTQGAGNSALTRKQEKLIRKYGVEGAIKKDESIRYKLLNGIPRLTTAKAVFGRDTLNSPREHRQILKQLGIYNYALRAQFLRRFANSLIRPGAVQKTKLFFFITIHKKDRTFRNALQKRLYNSTMKHLANIEALMALKCREELAKRDIHVDGRGKPVYLKGMPRYWQDNIDYASYRKASASGGPEFENAQQKWFNDRYGDWNEAKKMDLQLFVFESKRRAGDADDYVLQRQMEARDEIEINLWKSINEDYEAYSRTKQQIASILDSYKNNKT